MSNTDKVKTIEHIVVDALEYCVGESAEFYRGILNAVASVCDYEETDNG